MPVFHTKTIESILDPVAQQVNIYLLIFLQDFFFDITRSFPVSSLIFKQFRKVNKIDSKIKNGYALLFHTIYSSMNKVVEFHDVSGEIQ